jgi:hypothetical protein
MEDNKYYTPTIDEFHVGFEYERMNGDRWENSTLSEADCFGTIARGYENEFEEIDTGLRTIRVKYLDREDIESLGWKFSLESGDFTKGDDECIALGYDSEDHSLMVWNGLDWDDQHIWFDGFIKNKSELVKLLGQLDIKYSL